MKRTYRIMLGITLAALAIGACSDQPTAPPGTAAPLYEVKTDTTTTNAPQSDTTGRCGGGMVVGGGCKET